MAADPTTPHGPEHELSVALDYLDKLFQTSQRVEDSSARQFRAQAFASLLLLALTTGVVTTDESIEISGISLKLPLWIVIGGGAVLVCIVTMLAFLHNVHAARIREVVVDEYKRLGLDLPSRDADLGIDLSTTLPDVTLNVVNAQHTRSILNNVVGIVAGVAAFAALLVLPLVAQVAALLTLAGDFGWEWHIWLPLGGTSLLTLTTAIWILNGDQFDEVERTVSA
jgi:hypothetical protein